MRTTRKDLEERIRGLKNRMTKEDAELCMRFLARVDLKGSEVDAFNKVCFALQRIVTEEVEVNSESGNDSVFVKG